MSDIKLGFTATQLISENRTTNEDVALLKVWLGAQNLPKLTDEQIALFLLSCRNKQERTKRTIRAYYSARTGSPELFGNRRILQEDFKLQIRALRVCLFPVTTDDGCAIIYCGLQDTSHSNFELAAALKLLFMILDATVFDYPPKALHILYDMKGVGLMHLTKARIGLIKTYFHYLQEGLPLSLRKIHVLNTVSFLDKVLLLIKPFIKKDVMEMVQFHPSNMDLELFYKNCLPKRCLPEELGGDLPSVSLLHERTFTKLADMEPYFEAEENQRLEII